MGGGRETDSEPGQLSFDPDESTGQEQVGYRSGITEKLETNISRPPAKFLPIL